MERSSVQRMEDDVFCSRFMLPGELRDSFQSLAYFRERCKMYLDVRVSLQQTLSGGCVDVRVASMLADNVEDRVVSSSDIVSRYRCGFQLLLKGDKNAYNGDQEKCDSGEHGRLRASHGLLQGAREQSVASMVGIYTYVSVSSHRCEGVRRVSLTLV